MFKYFPSLTEKSFSPYITVHISTKAKTEVFPNFKGCETIFENLWGACEKLFRSLLRDGLEPFDRFNLSTYTAKDKTL